MAVEGPGISNTGISGAILTNLLQLKALAEVNRPYAGMVGDFAGGA